MRERCRYDLPLFAQFFFPDAVRLPFSPLHGYLFERRAAKGKRAVGGRRGEIDVVIAPRGAAKSTLTSLVLPIHALVYGIDPYILLISSTRHQARTRLANIRHVLAAGERLREFYEVELGDSRKNTEESIVVGATRIDAYSAGSELRGITFGGWRPTWIILDDVESSSRIIRSHYREKLYQWMTEVIENLGNGYTNIDLIGTLLHREALPVRLARRADVTSRTFRSIDREADAAHLWNRWKALLLDLTDKDRIRTARRFFSEREAEMMQGTRVLWPQKETYYDLSVMRVTRGRAAFNKEKQNLPPNETDATFDLSKVRKFSLERGEFVIEPMSGEVEKSSGPPSLDLADLEIFGFLDPALGEGARSGGEARGDFAAIVTAGADRHGYVYVLDVWLAREAPSAQIRRIFDLHDIWNYTEFGIETNAFQKMMLEPLEAERQKRKQAGKPWAVPTRGVRNTTNKRLRILGLEPLIASGWLLFSRDLPESFLHQLEEFPFGDHDDGPDALQGAVALARSRTRGGSIGQSAPHRRHGIRNY